MSPEALRAIIMMYVGSSFVMSMLFCSAMFGADSDQRLRVPDEQSQAVAETTIRSIYKTEFSKHAAVERAALARKLIKLADESKNDPASRFVLLRDAEDLALEAGDVDTAFSALETAVGAFELDPLKSKLAALTRAAPNCRTSNTNSALAETALGVCDEAMRADRFDAASQTAAIASAAAEKAHGKELVSRARRASIFAEQTRQAFNSSNDAVKKLQTDPADVAASTTLGKFLCFVRGEWEKGLPFLLHASDTELQNLAQLELASPAKASEMVMLADRWWQWSDKADHADADEGRARSAYWYRQALPDLTGLQKALAQRRVEQGGQETAIAAAGGFHVVDLIPLIDLKRDTVAGIWTIEGHTLLTTDGGAFSRIRIRYQPPSEYDFRVVFIRAAGNETVAQILSRDERTFSWLMGGWANTVCGFGRVAGRSIEDNPTTVRSSAALKDGVKYTSVVRVRRGSIAAYLDGKLISCYRTDFSDLSSQGEWDVGPNGLGLGSWGNRVEFQTVELIEVAGKGKPIPAAP